MISFQKINNKAACTGRLLETKQILEENETMNLYTQTHNEETVLVDMNGNYFGTLRSSVGRYGDSDGAFTRCETTTPLTELGIDYVDGRPVHPSE